MILPLRKKQGDLRPSNNYSETVQRPFISRNEASNWLEEGTQTSYANISSIPRDLKNDYYFKF